MTDSPVFNTTLSVAPSVYIAYQDLIAYVSCPSGETVARGRSYNTTIAYAPEDLSTAISARPQQTECTYITVNYTMLGDYSSSGNPDFFLSIPSSLTSLDPAWSTCTPALYGAWDPPTTLQPATALTTPAGQTTPSSPAAPVGRSTAVYAPATSTTATNDPATSTPSVALKPGVYRPSKHAKTNAAEPANPQIPQDFYKSAALGSPSDRFLSVPSIPDGKPDISDPSNITPDLTSSAVIASDSSHTPLLPSTPTPDLRLINGKSIARFPDGALVFASSTIAPGNQATIFGHVVSAGFSDAVIDGSKYTIPTHTAEKAQLSPITLANGIVARPDGNPNEVKIGDEIISANEPAATISGAAVSLAPSDLYIGSSVLSFPAETTSRSAGSGGLVMDASRSGQSATGNGSSGSNAVVFTGGALRSSHSHSIFALAFITAMVGLAL